MDKSPALIQDKTQDRVKSLQQKVNELIESLQQKLDEIEKKYEDKKIEVKKKYLMKRQQMWYTQKVTNIKAEEASVDAVEDKEAEALLDQI